jgi:hypothetical protein
MSVPMEWLRVDASPPCSDGNARTPRWRRSRLILLVRKHGSPTVKGLRSKFRDFSKRTARAQNDDHHVQANLPAAKTTTHAMRNRNIETAKLACFLNSLTRVVRRKKTERTKRKMGIAAARKAMILKIIVRYRCAVYSRRLILSPRRRARLGDSAFDPAVIGAIGICSRCHRCTMMRPPQPQISCGRRSSPTVLERRFP